MKYFRMNTRSDLPGSLKRPPATVLLCVAVLFAAALPTSVYAQEWRFEPIVRVGGEYDDNARLQFRTDQEVTLQGYLADLRALMTYSSEKTSFTLQPSAVLRRYPDEPTYDSEDYYLQSRFSRDTRSGTIGFRATYALEDVRTAERAVSDPEIDNPDEITDDDTGRVLLSGERSKWQITPNWGYRWSDVSSIGVDLDYFDVRYDETFSGLLSDYTDARLNLNYRRDFSNVNAGLLTLTGRKFSTAASPTDVNGYGLKVGFDRTLSEKTRLRAMIGVENTQQTNGQSEPEAVGDVTLVRDLKTIRMFAQYRRMVVASGAGGLSVRDAINVNFRRRLSEKISAGLGIRAYQSRGTGNSTSIDDRDYIQLQSSFLWYLSKSLVIETDYRYTISDRDPGIGERANSNQINVWLVYQPRTTPKL